MSDAEPDKSPTAPSKKKLLVGIFTAVIILSIVGGIYAVFKSINGPAEGVVSISTIPTGPIQSAPLKELTGKYYTSSYPGRYELQPSSKNSASLEAWLLVARQSVGGVSSAVISITVSKLPAGGVKEDGSYKQFEAFKNLYSLSTRTYSNEEVIVADRTETNFEHTVLWPHGEYLLSASMTSNQKNEAILAEFETILSTLKWKS